MAIIRPNTVSINTILHTATASITNKAMISDSSTVILRHQQDGLKPDWRDICIRDEQSSMPTYPAPSSTSPFFSLFLFLFFFFFSSPHKSTCWSLALVGSSIDEYYHIS